MKVDDNWRKISGKPRVSFSFPEKLTCGAGNNTAPEVSAVRLTRPYHRPIGSLQKQTDKSIAGNLDSCKIKQTQTKKYGLSNHASIPKGCSVQKHFVRDSELPVSKSARPQHSAKSSQGVLKTTLLNKYNAFNECTSNQASCQSKAGNYRSECDYPELLSSLSIAKKIQFTTAALKEPRDNIYSLNPLVEQEIEEKASNRLNFPFDELVYRNLVTLNIRDEDFAGSNREQCKCSRDFESTHPRDEEPVLSEFYQPRFGEEYSSVIYPVPSSIDKFRRFNGLAIYNKMHNWE